ncbi:MAG: hypothetical protein J4G14_02500 [Dehalococcoidia bacterium]|nr:hypothetical protein [Dehalococcoidia bacterium]
MRDTHTRDLTARLVLTWLSLTQFKSARQAALTLRVSAPSFTNWVKGLTEPSRVHLGKMAGYYAEGDNGLSWSRYPVQQMVSHVAAVGGINRDRVLQLAMCRDPESPHKQSVWRLFELSMFAKSGYPLDRVQFIDWMMRQTSQSEPPPIRRVGALWLPRDPLHLSGCPAPGTLADSSGDPQEAVVPVQTNGNVSVQFRTPPKRVSLYR